MVTKLKKCLICRKELHKTILLYAFMPIFYLLLALAMLPISCTNTPTMKTSIPSSALDVQGHRGCRGLMPENSLPAFLHAIDLGVTTLEMDVVLSGDGQVVVSHEPWFSPEFCLDPQGKPLDAEGAPERYNLYRMDYAQIRSYDCGSKPHARFPGQRLQPTHKPTLDEVLLACEAHSRGKIRYNVEVKCSPEQVGIFHPDIDTFTRLVIEALEARGVQERCTLQSFAPDCLRAARRLRPQLTLALLVESEPDPTVALGNLGFDTPIYSPHYQLLDAKRIEELHRRGLKVIPWTVNDTKDMEQLVGWGVDGIITDYPDRLLELVGRQ